LNDIRAERPDLTSLSQLVQELIGGTLRRNIFTECELQLLLDLQGFRIRKSAKPDILRRYLKAMQHHSTIDSSVPLRFAHFFEKEQHRVAAASSSASERVLGAGCPS